MWSTGDEFFNSPKHGFSPFSHSTYRSDHTTDYSNRNIHHHRGERRHWDHRNSHHHNNRKHFPFHSDASETDTSITDHHHYSSHMPKFDTFHPTPLNLPRRAARSLAPEDILILPSLTRLRISLQDPYAHNLTRSIRATVAGDMRIRDATKQVLPSTYLSDARTEVKLRGEWSEVGAPIMVSEVAAQRHFATNERGEMEVRVVLGGRGREVRGWGMGPGPRFGWERGSVERLRVY